MKNNQIPEFANLRLHEPIILIEFCSNCLQHNNSLRHDSQKYLQKALTLKSAIQREFPFFKIVLKPLSTNQPESLSKLGLFEVTLAAFDLKVPKLLGSKLKTLQWPETRTIISNIRSFFPGRSLIFNLKLPAQSTLHPQNPFSSSIKTVLVSHYDLPLFQEKILAMENEKKVTRAATSFPKARKLSAIVTKKIQSGIEKETEINDLIFAKDFIFKEKPDQNLSICFNNVKPGAYKFMVTKNKDFQETALDILIQPVFRHKDAELCYDVNLQFAQTAFLDIYLESETENPVFKVSFHKNGPDQNESEVEEELIIRNSRFSEGKELTHYNLSDLSPSLYKLVIEYKDYQTFSETFQVYPGRNALKVSYPKLQTTFFPSDFPENNIKESNQNRQKTVNQSDRTRNLDNRNNQPPNSANKPDTRISGSSEKENVKNRQPHKLTDSPKTDKKSNVDSEKKTDENPSNFQKQRGASGNRIRPGERLYSAKSKNNQLLNEESTKGSIVINQHISKFAQDSVIQFLEKSVLPNSLNIFLRTSKHFKLEFEFVIDKSDSLEDHSQFYQEQLIDGLFEHHSLKHINGFEFGRIFIEKLSPSSDVPVELVLIHGSSLTKVNLSHFFAQFCNENESFCDIAFITNNSSQTDFQEIINLVPLAEPIKCFTGILEIKSIINFVKNSKFGVSKFFGFEIDEDENAQSYQLDQKDVIENLRNYEIDFSNQYILNAVRTDKNGTVSLQKLQEVYLLWQKMSDGIENMDFEENEEGISEKDEEFETGDNVDDSAADNKLNNSNDEFNDEDFDA